ncbi:MAG: acyl carrier protein [Deltaproteobacteria bacterium]|nr:acyl carrier protein [Deltaproteobacteria bacterium]
MTTNRTELLTLFHKMATEIAEKEFPPFTEQTVISDLGIDSLAMLELVGAMERHFEIRIPDEQLVGITTVNDLLAVVEKGIAAARA